MKYKKGDRVRVRPDLEVGKIYGSDSFVEAMEHSRGREFTVSAVDDVQKKYYLDGCGY